MNPGLERESSISWAAECFTKRLCGTIDSHGMKR
jgi:hypothetical protein